MQVVISALNKTVEEKITFISLVTASGGKSFPIEITMDNAKGELKAGMSGNTIL